MKRFFKYVYSFVFEELIERADSLVNTDLSVAYGNGKLLLNSANLNYAYGSLHNAFQKEFRRLKVKDLEFKNVLILGFGVGSIASILLDEYKKDCSITGVEIDPAVLNLGKKYFKNDQFKNVVILCENAIDFMTKNERKYDFIIVDIYIGNDVPECCETEQFLTDIKKSMSPGGLFLFNKYIYDNQSQITADVLLNRVKKIFGDVVVHNDNGYMISCKST